MIRRTGRRSGKQNTREEILTAARKAFAEHGFDRATIRQIAAAAGVDPALVHHYFGSKEQLFAATLNLPINPAELVQGVFDEGRDGVGERLVRAFIVAWDSPVGTAGVALLRSAVGSELAARLMREFVFSQIVRRAVANLALDPHEAPLRVSLVASQISGLALTRYILKIEPLASAPRETLVAAIAPTVQRYLTGDFPR